ncbi:MDR family MFS transporter [Lentzea cavernae]|uniref:MFS transporter n=1 Tax=Lentzea cavernae TaxID=2020703 RepID=A0ABQ3M6A2_9PSEU|nr:MDR family MFS transporter [Lentzea cavernae]GHH34750.1 MFS transporter [Lentzea cavernae]
MSSTSTKPRPRVFDRQMSLVACVTVLGSLVVIFDTTIVHVAVPSLVRSFDTSLSAVQWVSTAYLLALAGVVPLTRWANDRFGLKRSWIASMSMFLVGSLLCGLADSMPLLIAARVVQGLGGGMLLPTGQSILARHAGPARLGRVMSIVGIPAMLGPLLGPILGGLILSSFSWRWIFIVNLPVGAIALALAVVVLDRGGPGESRRLDVVGLCLLPPGLALLVYGITDFGSTGAVTAPVVVGSGLGVALLCGFVFHALRAEHPLLDLRLWKNRAFRAAGSSLFLYLAGTNAVLFLIQLYFQFARGASALESALLVAPSAFGAMLVLLFAGCVMERFGARALALCGLAMVFLGVLPMAFIGPDTSDVWLAACWFVRGVGVGAASTPLTTASYLTLRSADIPGASTLMSINQYVAGALGTAVVAVLLQHQVDGITGGRGVDALAELDDAARAQLSPSLADAFATLSWLPIALTVLAVIPALLLPGRAEKAS